jgi:hypothetical protein
LKVKCVKSICQSDSKFGLMQVFYRKDGSIASARIRHYIGTEAGKPKFSYCPQSIAFAEAEVMKVGQKPLIESVASKAIAAGINHEVDLNGQVSGQLGTGTELQSECGCSLAWFRTSACHVDDPGSNPGNRTIKFNIMILLCRVKRITRLLNTD